MIRKTAAITAASIAGVMLAGSAAVGANIGILDAADDTGLGTLSAEAVIAAPADPTTTTTTEPASGPATSAVTVGASDHSGVQTFAVDAAGTVDLETDDSGLHVIAVHANDGWTWEETSRGPDAVTLTFTSGDDTLEFVASLNADGSIDARVDRPIVTSVSPSVTSPAPASAPAVSYDDDDDEHEDHDDDHDEGEDHDEDDDDHEDHEHEGHDDDD